ncbi:MAG: DUF3465 domain-containing protein [Synechococcales cyanobacterium CRU_2_2]|nr:DUF3465 domain-containing protein [Synechococcales cyanobacterium CRU_2_2]
MPARSPKPKLATSPKPTPPEPQASDSFGLSDLIVEATGEVLRLLEDDLEGSHHQRFVVRLKTYDVLVCHNIDLSPRIEPLAAGDRVSFKGEYEWSDQGGTIHWTHKDPKRWHPDGWIDHGGKRYD